MKKIIVLIIAYIVISNYNTDIASIEGISGWQVSVDDSKSYIFTEVYDQFHPPNHQVIIEEYDENGTIEITLKKGTILSYTITQLNTLTDTIYGYRTYNNNLSLREELFSEIVRKIDSNYQEENSVQIGNSLIREEELYISSYYTQQIIHKKSIFNTYFKSNAYPYMLRLVSVWDIQTGWIVSSSHTAYGTWPNSSAWYNITLEVVEEEETSIFNFPTNLIFGSSVIACIILIYFVSKFFLRK